MTAFFIAGSLFGLFLGYHIGSWTTRTGRLWRDTKTTGKIARDMRRQRWESIPKTAIVIAALALVSVAVFRSVFGGDDPAVEPASTPSSVPASSTPSQR